MTDMQEFQELYFVQKEEFKTNIWTPYRLYVEVRLVLLLVRI
jgi:hypothetical protein